MPRISACKPRRAWAFCPSSVEFDASSRARRQLNELGLVVATEGAGVKSVLRAAAWTYVAGALAAVAILLYYLSLLSNR